MVFDKNYKFWYKRRIYHHRFRNADCVVFANNHYKYYALDIEKLIGSLNNPAIFIDTWYIFNPNEIKREGIVYGGLGVD